MMNYKRGDVVLVRFPHSDLVKFSKRPALVVQADNLNTDLPQKIVAMITSNLSRTGPTRMFVTKDSSLGKEMGVTTDSMVVADNLATVREAEIDKVIGTCSQIDPVNQALRTTLSL